MTFEQLEYFIAAVREGTFLDAAESLHISQSSLSKQIIKLEKELDLPLFDRSRRHAVLTPAGELFYREALSLNRQYREMRAHLNDYKAAADKSVRIGTLPLLTHYHLTALLNKFSLAYPDYNIIIDEVEEKELLSGLNWNAYDLVIARDKLLDETKFELYPLAEDSLMVILPRQHLLASASKLSISDLRDEKFVLMNRYTAIYSRCMEEFEAAGVTPQVVRNARVESIISAVTVGEGISLLAASNLDVFHSSALTAIPLDPPVKLPVVLATQKRQEKFPALDAVIAYLLQPSSDEPIDETKH